jgi:hypothetical protein
MRLSESNDMSKRIAGKRLITAFIPSAFLGLDHGQGLFIFLDWWHLRRRTFARDRIVFSIQTALDERKFGIGWM